MSTEHTCKRCGKQFISDRQHKGKVYCSKACMKLDYSKRFTGKTRVTPKQFSCKRCGKTFSKIDYYKPKNGNFCSLNCWIKYSKGTQLTAWGYGDKNHMWKGDKVSYYTLHKWVRLHKPKPQVCEHCESISPHDVANISGEYKRDISDYRWLCKPCHQFMDNVKAGRTIIKVCKECKLSFSLPKQRSHRQYCKKCRTRLGIKYERNCGGKQND